MAKKKEITANMLIKVIKSKMKLNNKNFSINNLISMINTYNPAYVPKLYSIINKMQVEVIDSTNVETDEEYEEEDK